MQCHDNGNEFSSEDWIFFPVYSDFSTFSAGIINAASDCVLSSTDPSVYIHNELDIHCGCGILRKRLRNRVLLYSIPIRGKGYRQ